jgi:uncharacterized protein YrrD
MLASSEVGVQHPIRHGPALASLFDLKTLPATAALPGHGWKGGDMVRSSKHMKRFTIAATDGDIGAVDDFYFDDERWAVRYLVVDTGKWLSGRHVLISPISVLRAEWGEQRLLVSISRDQVHAAPEIDTHQPVSRQQEAAYLDHFHYPYYWAAPGLWGSHPTPMMPTPEELAAADRRAAEAAEQARRRGDTHLRSTSEVTGYVIRATDGDLGHVDDVLFDDVSWAVRYLVVDTSNWWFGKHVLIAPEWVDGIDWVSRTVSVNMARAALKSAPLYDRAEHVDRQWEAAYYQHLQRPGYWLDADEARAIQEAHQYLNESQPESDPLDRRSRPR